MTFTESTPVATAAAEAVGAPAPVKPARTPKTKTPPTPREGEVADLFDLTVFEEAAAAEVDALLIFDRMHQKAIGWYALGEYPDSKDIGEFIHRGYEKRQAAAKALGVEVKIPNRASCDQYGSAVKKWAEAGEWPKGPLASFSPFQKKSPTKKSGKGRPAGTAETPATETPATETPATETPETPAASQVWKGLMPLLTQVRNGADIGIAWQETDKAQAAELARQMIALIGQYVKA